MNRAVNPQNGQSGALGNDGACNYILISDDRFVFGVKNTPGATVRDNANIPLSVVQGLEHARSKSRNSNNFREKRRSSQQWHLEFPQREARGDKITSQNFHNRFFVRCPTFRFRTASCSILMQSLFQSPEPLPKFNDRAREYPAPHQSALVLIAAAGRTPHPCPSPAAVSFHQPHHQSNNNNCAHAERGDAASGFHPHHRVSL